MGPAALAGTPAQVVTVPANTKAIVRHVHVSNPSGGAGTVTLSIGADAVGTRVFDQYSISAGSVLDHFCYYVIDNAGGGESRMDAGGSTFLVMTIDGEDYTAG